MKKNLLYTLMAIGCLSLASCGEDDLTPSIDISPEYEANLALTKSSIHADTVIYKWYQKYNTAILYKFNDNDPTWLWSSKLTNGFKKFDEAYENGIIDKVLTTNLVYQPEELLSKPWYIDVDMSKYIAYIIDTLNHDSSISDLLNPYDRIKNYVKKYNDEKNA